MEIKEFAMCEACKVLEDIEHSDDECTNCGDELYKPVLAVVCESREEFESAKANIEAVLSL